MLRTGKRRRISPEQIEKLLAKEKSLEQELQPAEDQGRTGGRPAISTRKAQKDIKGAKVLAVRAPNGLNAQQTAPRWPTRCVINGRAPCWC